MLMIAWTDAFDITGICSQNRFSKLFEESALSFSQAKLKCIH